MKFFGLDSFKADRRVVLLGATALAGLSACNSGEPVEGGGAPEATTTNGPVRGGVESGVNVFKGVRYGASTAGANRFMPPQAPEPWTEVADATAYREQSPQVPAGNGGGLYTSWSNRLDNSEDCLFLNVWTPGVGDGGNRPVLVWFHGGGFTTGSGSSFGYDGVNLCNRGDVVVVTVNHRLNAFGYTYFGDMAGEAFADSGNAGNLDMVASLEWVHDNIAEFGGDPNTVLIMGESGGGSKVSNLMATPPAQGLFHRAVVQSGSSLTSRTPEVAQATTQRLMEAVGASTAEELQAAPMEDIVAAMADTVGLGFGPVVDGRSLPRHPFTPDAPDMSSGVPMLIGSNKDEYTALRADDDLFNLTWEALPEAVAGLNGDYDGQAAIAMERELDPDATAGAVFYRIMSDAGFRRSAIIQAERKAAAGGAPAFMYYLTWDTPVDGGKFGSPHALDIALMFDNVAKSDTIIGDGVEEAQQVADAMSTAWINFARDGNPGWEPYNAETRPTMVFDVQSEVVNDPRGGAREFFAAS